jgi:L-fuconolactonase
MPARVICDSQIHAPCLPSSRRARGLTYEQLISEMDRADVDRCVVVPVTPVGNDDALYNKPALDLVGKDLSRLAVMGRFDLTRPNRRRDLLEWRSSRGMLGVRLAMLNEPNRSLYFGDELDWFWSAAEEADLPLMLLLPANLDPLKRVLDRHQGLRVIIDHFNLASYVDYPDLVAAVQPVIGLARRPNIAVKASALPYFAHDRFPFVSLHKPIQSVVDAFGPERVFWGSDLTRLPCKYSECVRLFTEELPFLDQQALDWIMGRSIQKWLGWSTPGV